MGYLDTLIISSKYYVYNITFYKALSNRIK